MSVPLESLKLVWNCLNILGFVFALLSVAGFLLLALAKGLCESRRKYWAVKQNWWTWYLHQGCLVPSKREWKPYSRQGFGMLMYLAWNRSRFKVLCWSCLAALRSPEQAFWHSSNGLQRPDFFHMGMEHFGWKSAHLNIHRSRTDGMLFK